MYRLDVPLLMDGLSSGTKRGVCIDVYYYVAALQHHSGLRAADSGAPACD
jgi:sulfate adenylyltransferase subunit 1 (EFTu-like GTPase family)